MKQLKKLTLRKEVVVELNSSDMNQLQGGNPTSDNLCTPICNTNVVTTCGCPTVTPTPTAGVSDLFYSDACDNVTVTGKCESVDICHCTYTC
jgi:natural product precursor